MYHQLKRRNRRKGVTVVEFAIVAPLLFSIVLVTVEFGRALMVTQSLEEAARGGCRVAVLPGATTTEIEAEVQRVLAMAGVSQYACQVQPSGYALAERWSPVTVTVSAWFSDISWVPLPRYLGGQSYSATCTLPKEYSTGN